MSERLLFIQACLDRREPLAAIFDRFGISEKTGYKWLARFRAGGVDALHDRTHAPLARGDLVSTAVATRIIALRRQHPLYGAAKLRDWLVQNEPGTRWPAASTIGTILHRAGLIRRRVRHRVPGAPSTHQRTAGTAANVVWTADFKGQFRLATGQYCYPLTVLDLHSHFLLGCTALSSTAVLSTRQAFTRLFRAFGLPQVIRTDNGVPFAQPNAAGRYGALAFWWVRLGIYPEHIRPARPAENGAHERFHKTLKAHTVRSVAASLEAQQKRFDRFRREYNDDRPHESTAGRRPPASGYAPSARAYPERLPPLVYPKATTVRRVDGAGKIKWHNQPIFLTYNLTGEVVGLTELASDQILVQYAQLTLGCYDPHLKRFTSRFEWLPDATP